MTKRIHLCTLILAAGLFSCNPDCESVFGLRITTAATEAGNEILITAQPPSSLQGRRVFIKEKEVQTRFAENMGLVVTVPDGLSGAVDVRVEDPDCADFVSLNLDVEDASFFENNPQFVFPTIPEIVIPTLQAAFPPSIENAWLHPENLDYCIWFKIVPDASGNCTRVIDPANSFEQSTCFRSDDNRLYRQNPMFGYIDVNDKIHLTILRSDGPEEFDGCLVNLMDVPEKYRAWKSFPTPCPTIDPLGLTPVQERSHMMVLTSKRNGKQLIIYQQEIAQVPPNCQQ